MIALLDVNVLVSLFDPVHAQHEAAHGWLSENRSSGWATSPITENGLVRIISNPSYPGRRTTIADALRRLRQFRMSGDHVFWPDSVSICDETLAVAHVQGHRQLTDLYLLALAVRQNGCLVTFDRNIPHHAVVGADRKQLLVIEAAEH